MRDLTFSRDGKDDEVSSRASADPAAVPSRGRLIVIANRQPLRHLRRPSGESVVQRATSGLVAASELLVRQAHGVWIAQGESRADMLDGGSHEPVPPHDPEYVLRRLWLDPSEQEGYYDRFSNEGLWPLCHETRVQPRFNASDFDAYWSVNARFVDAAVEETLGGPAVVVVQDYHFALAPLLLRQQLPEAAVVAFWHVPWPSVERLEACPWATYLIEGLLGSHLLGFQTPRHCANFLDAAEHLLGADVERRRGVVSYLGRRTHVRAYPASIEWDSAALRAAPSIEDCGRAVRHRFGIQDACRIIAGVDRMDYTKGLEEKLLTFERLLERFPERVRRAVLVQVAQPTRRRLPAYQEYSARVRQLAEGINRSFGRDGWRPVVLVERELASESVFELLRAADVCCVASLDDGMNLVAKEYVNARDDERGVLLLSSFTGAACELPHAAMFDPRNVDASAHMMEEALRMAPDEQKYRMRRMRDRVRRWDAAAWAHNIMADAAQLCSASALQPYRAETAPRATASRQSTSAA